MANFPTGFTESRHVTQYDVPGKYSLPFIQLEHAGFAVVAGLTKEDVPALTEIAEQAGTREFCPNDIATRWTDKRAAKAQLGKDGGRGVLRLVSLEDDQTIGFGWTGAISDKEKGFLPDCENTFALRLHEAARGKKLATPFSRAIVAGSMALWGARRIGLETWGSNTPAVKAYLGAGAQLVTTKDDVRPTLIKENQDKNGNRQDIRLYMQYPWSM
jgi:hypothetical protein